MGGMRELTAPLRPLFAYAALFSLAINLLLLAAPLYMLQVFDRVLASRSDETLLVLTAATVGALALMAFLDALRARLLAAAAVSLDRRLGPRVIDGLVARAGRLGGAAYLTGLRDVGTLRGRGCSRSSTRRGCRSSSRSSSFSIRCSARWRRQGRCSCCCSPV